MSLLSLLNHHMAASSAAPQANSFGSSAKLSLTLSQHVVHPHLPSDPAAEAWIQALLSTVRLPTAAALPASLGRLELTRQVLVPRPPSQHSAVAHEPPPEPAVGDPAEHEVRRQRALRVCAALSGMHDWKGRVGLVGDAEPDDAGEAAGAGSGSGAAPAADAIDEDNDDDDDDMFGSGDEDDKKAAAPGPEAQKVPAVPALGKAETEQELRRLLGLMARGQPPS